MNAESGHGNESVCSSSNRKRERRNSDSSMLDFMTEANPKQRCSLSQEALDLNSSIYSIHSQHGAAISFTNQSFSQDGVVPGHNEAEMYFSSQADGTTAEPNFNDSHIMDKSLVDIGIIKRAVKTFNSIHPPPRQSKPRVLNNRSPSIISNIHSSMLNSTTSAKLSPRAKTKEIVKDCMPSGPLEVLSDSTNVMQPLHSRCLLKDTQNYVNNPARTQPPSYLDIRSKFDVAHPRLQESPDSTTPSPTTHDLVLDPLSSPEPLMHTHHVCQNSNRTHFNNAKKSLVFEKSEPFKHDDGQENMQVSFV